MIGRIPPEVDTAMVRREDVSKALTAASWEHGHLATDAERNAWVAATAKVFEAVHALPAIGTCKDCADWHEWRGGEYGGCWSGAYIATGCIDLGTKPDHYCVAYRRKEANPDAN